MGSEQEATEFMQNLMPFMPTDESASEVAEELIIEACKTTNKLVRISKAQRGTANFSTMRTCLSASCDGGKQSARKNILASSRHSDS